MKSLVFLATILLVACSVQGQDPEQLRKVKEFQERGARITKAYDAISSASPALRSLNELGKRKEMIVEAGRTGDPAMIPHLQVLAYDQIPFTKLVPRSLIGTEAYLAHIALAKLGDPGALPAVFAELQSTDAMTQDAAVAKLGQIGGKEAYRKLFQLLDDTSSRSHPPDNPVIPIAEHAMEVLSDLFSDTPRKPNGMTNYDRADWKTWAAKNKHLID